MLLVVPMYRKNNGILLPICTCISNIWTQFNASGNSQCNEKAFALKPKTYSPDLHNKIDSKCKKIIGLLMSKSVHTFYSPCIEILHENNPYVGKLSLSLKKLPIWASRLV